MRVSDVKKLENIEKQLAELERLKAPIERKIQQTRKLALANAILKCVDKNERIYIEGEEGLLAFLDTHLVTKKEREAFGLKALEKSKKRSTKTNKKQRKTADKTHTLSSSNDTVLGASKLPVSNSQDSLASQFNI